MGMNQGVYKTSYSIDSLVMNMGVVVVMMMMMMKATTTTSSLTHGRVLAVLFD